MNEQKVSEERLVELIDDERLGLNYLMNECISGEPDPDARTMCQDKLSALRELLTLRQSASGEIEALEAGADVLHGCEGISNMYGHWYTGAACTKYATTLRHMAARMK